MDKPRTPKPSWPLQLHETIGKIEKRTRECLEDCASGDSLLTPVLLDLARVTQIMRASAIESFRARMEYYQSQSHFRRDWLGEVLDETVTATLQQTPLSFMRGSRYKEAVPAIREELEAELRDILEQTPDVPNLVLRSEFVRAEEPKEQSTAAHGDEKHLGARVPAKPASGNHAAAGMDVVTFTPSWEQLASELERLQAVEPLRAQWYAYVGSESYGNWLLRPDGERTAMLRANFTLIAAHIIEKLEIAPIPVPHPVQYCPHWADECGVEEDMARNVGQELDLSDAVPYGQETIDRDAVDPCTRAFLDVLRSEGLAFQIKQNLTSFVKGQTYSSVIGSIEDLCEAAAAYCKRRARDEIGARLRSRLENAAVTPRSVDGSSGHPAADVLDPFRDAGERPLGDNPFPAEHPAYQAFEEATWKAKEAVNGLRSELLETISKPPFDFVQSILTFRVREVSACANAALLFVGNEQTDGWTNHGDNPVFALSSTQNDELGMSTIEDSPRGDVVPVARRTRGRPIQIPEERKQRALAVRGGKARAQILYGTKYPTPQQVKNVSSILRHYRAKHK